MAVDDSPIFVSEQQFKFPVQPYSATLEQVLACKRPCIK